MAESGADQWSDDCITLQQLYDLFTSNMDASLIQSVPQELDITSNDSSSDNEEEADLNNTDEMDL